MADVMESISNIGILTALSAPFECLHSREGAGGKSFTYVPGGDVLERVLMATEGAFEWEILDIRLIESQTKTTKGATRTTDAFWLVHGRLTIAGLGSKDATGTAVLENEDSPKAAETDAFKRAAVKFGVALQLYRKDEQAAPSARSGGNRSNNSNDSGSKPRGSINDTGAKCPRCNCPAGKPHGKPCI